MATALGDAIESSVVTKGDLVRLEASIASHAASAGASLVREVTRLEGAIGGLEMSSRAELHASELRMTVRLGGIIVTAIGVLFALLRLTGHAP